MKPSVILYKALPENLQKRLEDHFTVTRVKDLSPDTVAQHADVFASAAGLRSAVIMETNGAEVYEGLIEIIHGISDRIPPEEFDREACSMTLQSLREGPRLLVSYFIGIDKSVHMGREWSGIRSAVLHIDRCIGDITEEADEKTLLIICGDHPIHAGPLKRSSEPYYVALILGRGRSKDNKEQNIDSIGLNVASE